MKKTIITCLTLFAISLCLFVSCSAENTAVNEINDVAYVTFGRDSRDFSASYIVQSYNDLFWFYTAEKADNYGTTGATIDLKAVPTKEDGKGIGSGTVGPFSQGKWTFTLSAYASLNEDNTPKTDTLVYQSGEITVTLNGGETKAIPVTVSPVGETGTIKFDNAYFSYDKEGSAAPKFLIRAVGEKATYELSNDEDYITEHDGTIRIRLTKNGNEYKIAFVEEDGKLSDSIVGAASVGYYTCEAYAYTGSISDSMAFCTFGMRVYGNATTVISGKITEETTSYIRFDVAESDIKAFPGSTKEVEVNVAPVSGGTTKVNFSGASLETNATYAVNVEALTANAANDAFQNSSSITEKEKEVLGSVKLSLTQIKGSDATSIEKFNGDVTVFTYIGEGLVGDISVVYNGNGDAPTEISYDKTTGIASFKTKHFSEFFIVRDGNVYNKNQNRYYYSLEGAIDKAGSFDEITLINNITLNEILTIKDGKSIVINMNSKKIIRDEKTAISIHDALVIFTGEGTIQGGNNSIIIEAVKNEETYLSIGKDITLMAGEDGAGLGVFNYDDKLTPYKNVTVDFSGRVTSGAFGITVNGLMIQQNNATVINIYDGASLVGTGSGIYAAGYAEWNIDNAYVEGSSALEVRAGNVNINGGTYNATAKEYKCVSNPSGQTTDGVAIAVVQHTTRLPINVNVADGEFLGCVAFSEKNLEKGNAKDITVNITGGKFNTTDTSESKQVVVSTDLKNFISGGSFNDKPADDYIADGYCYSNGKIAKVQGIAKINGEDVKIANISDVAAKSFEEVKDITIDLDKDSSLTLDTGYFNEGALSKSITLVGKLDDYGNPCTTIDVVKNSQHITSEGKDLNYQKGSTFTFKNLVIESGEGNYNGIVCGKVTYENCVIKNSLTLYGEATFIDCTFENNMTDQYSIRTWGGTDVTFEGCTFNTTNGKAILLYGVGKTTNLTVNNCVFNDRTNGAKEKAAIEIGDDYKSTNPNSFTVVINNPTVNGFAEGKNTGSKLWANKNNMDAAHLTVTIDGEKIQ